jgi:hypothetical protein
VVFRQIAGYSRCRSDTGRGKLPCHVSEVPSSPQKMPCRFLSRSEGRHGFWKTRHAVQASTTPPCAACGERIPRVACLSKVRGYLLLESRIPSKPRGFVELISHEPNKRNDQQRLIHPRDSLGRAQ